jgi:hypothetical protein
MKLVLDAEALIGIDRHDHRVAGLIELGRRAEAVLVTTAPVLGQAWRHGARQAQLARALDMIEIRTVTVDDAKRAGELLASAGTSDIIDALLVNLVMPGDQILTSDPRDIEALLDARSVGINVVRV